MAKSKEELIYDIENELVDPETNKITGDRIKARLLDMVETMAESAGSGGGGQMKYYRLEPEAQAAEFIYVMGSLLKAHPTEDASRISIMPAVMLGTPISLFTIVGGAVDLSLRFIGQGQDMTIGEFFDFALDNMGFESLEEIGAIEITKEEFYTI